MGKQAFKYIFICIGIYLGMSIIEIFLFKPLINLMVTGIWSHLIIYNILLIIVNPIVLKIIMDKCFNFKAEIYDNVHSDK